MVFGRVGVLVLLTVFIPISTYASQHPVVQRVSTYSEISDGAFVVDTRPLASCRKITVQGATCLPIEDVLAPNQRLANWSGILWLLGTAGLQGNEHVAIVGQHEDRRGFLAGLLALTGQKRVSIIESPVADLLANGESSSIGKMRATTRSSVYTAPMRSQFIVLANEVGQLINSNAIILDGRSEAEYYGVKIRAARGGHLPGAAHSPLSQWRTNTVQNAALFDQSIAVAYAHNTFEGLVYFSTLLAAGTQARLYLAGWSEWASNGALPADSVSYPAHSFSVKQRSNIPATTHTEPAGHGIVIAGLLVIGLLLLAVFITRQFSKRVA